MYYNKKTIIFLDGNWINANNASTNLYGQSLHYGLGVFEGIRSYKTNNGVNIFKAEEHFDRLHYSAKKMYIKLDYTVKNLIDFTYELLEINKIKDAYIRPLVYLGADMSLKTSKEVHLMICAWEQFKYLGERKLRLMTSSFQRPNPKSCFVEAKVTGHYTNSILATTEAVNNGFDEALLLDLNNYVAEGPGANFFYEKNGTLYTPPSGNILSGITRKTIFQLAKENSINVEERLFSKEDVYNADSAFFTGTAAEIAPIESLDNHNFNLPWNKTIGFKLAIAYQQLVHTK